LRRSEKRAIQQNPPKQLALAKTGLRAESQPELRGRGSRALGATPPARFERRTLGGKPEAARGAVPVRRRSAAASAKDLAGEGEAPASAALKSGAPEQLGFTFHFDTIAESCESSSAMTVLE
jgi:hypothetical protein